MLEESVSSVPTLWATVNSWFTPTVLFLFLNLMIATIALTSSLTKPHHPEHEQEQQHPQQQEQELQEAAHNLQGSPSVLQRLRSINFYSHRSPPTDTHFAEQDQNGGDDNNRPFSFARSPSSVLQRLRSLSFYSGNSPPEPASPTATADGSRQNQKPLERRTRLSFEETREEELASRDGEGKEEQEEEEDEEEVGDELSSLDEIYSQLKGAHQVPVARTKSDTMPASGEVPTKLPKKMKKSASAKSAFAHFAEEDIVETFRPASAREPKAKVSDDDEEGEEEEGEVDAKADDFINRFKQQLKLQRIDSIMRYKDMVNRGGTR